MPRSGGATSQQARRRSSASPKQPTRLASPDTEAVAGSRASEGLVASLQEASERATGTRSIEAALVYLRSSRLLVPPPAPLDPAEQRKLTGEMADMVADVIAKVLDGLGLSDADWERGRNIAMEALTAASRAGWEPL